MADMMPPGGSPTAMPTQGDPSQGQAPTMPPEQAIAIMKKFGISQQDLPEIQAAVEALEAAGIIQEAPEPAGEDQGPPPANAKLAQMLAG